MGIKSVGFGGTDGRCPIPAGMFAGGNCGTGGGCKLTGATELAGEVLEFVSFMGAGVRDEMKIFIKKIEGRSRWFR